VAEVAARGLGRRMVAAAAPAVSGRGARVMWQWSQQVGNKVEDGGRGSTSGRWQTGGRGPVIGPLGVTALPALQSVRKVAAAAAAVAAVCLVCRS
jgi:hypothetical protein